MMDKRQKWRLGAEMTAIGGLGYNLIELLWRGRTHWSMFFVGGACFQLIGQVGHRVKAPLAVRCGLCALGVTAVELVSGCILNLWLKLGVWDDSRMKYNIKGQVCLLYSVFWLLLSAAALPLYALCRKGLVRLHRTR